MILWELWVVLYFLAVGANVSAYLCTRWIVTLSPKGLSEELNPITRFVMRHGLMFPIWVVVYPFQFVVCLVLSAFPLVQLLYVSGLLVWWTFDLVHDLQELDTALHNKEVEEFWSSVRRVLDVHRLEDIEQTLV